MIKERGIERRFSTYEGVICFCKELINGGFEGLCDCVGESLFKDKADRCGRAISGPPQLRPVPSHLRKLILKWKQEFYPDKYRCGCNVDSTGLEIEWRETDVCT
jgi:hypothetical protein